MIFDARSLSNLSTLFATEIDHIEEMSDDAKKGGYHDDVDENVVDEVSAEENVEENSAEEISDEKNVVDEVSSEEISDDENVEENSDEKISDDENVEENSDEKISDEDVDKNYNVPLYPIDPDRGRIKDSVKSATDNEAEYTEEDFYDEEEENIVKDYEEEPEEDVEEEKDEEKTSEEEEEVAFASDSDAEEENDEVSNASEEEEEEEVAFASESDVEEENDEAVISEEEEEEVTASDSEASEENIEEVNDASASEIEEVVTLENEASDSEIDEASKSEVEEDLMASLLEALKNASVSEVDKESSPSEMEIVDKLFGRDIWAYNAWAQSKARTNGKWYRTLIFKFVDGFLLKNADGSYRKIENSNNIKKQLNVFSVSNRFYDGDGGTFFDCTLYKYENENRYTSDWKAGAPCVGSVKREYWGACP